MSLAFWVCVLLTLVSSLVSLGYALTGLQSSTAASRIPSQYALARSAALVGVAAVAIFSASTGFAAAAAMAMIAVQSFDAVIGGLSADRIKTFGPAFTALANTVALVWLLSS